MHRAGGKPQQIEKGERIVHDVGVAIEGLGVAEGGSGETSGVGGSPAAEGGGVLAEEGVVEGGFGVALVGGEFVGGDGGAGDLFAEGEEVEVVGDHERRAVVV